MLANYAMRRESISLDLKCPGKLDFNAPLLSTRRLGCSVVAGTSCSSNYSLGIAQNTSQRIPFSWEQAPGKPKDMERGDSFLDEGTSRPRLPPCLRSPPKEAEAEAADADADVFDDDCLAILDQDGVCDGVVDEDDDDDSKINDVFSDAMDVFSGSEALDFVQKSEEAQSDTNNDGLRLKFEDCNGNESPSYMIQRLLPDATALAAASAFHVSRSIDKKVCDRCGYPGAYFSGAATLSYATPLKGCGLEFLFPSRVKQKLCAMKSPVLPCSTNLQKHLFAVQIRKNIYSASTHKPRTNVKG